MSLFYLIFFSIVLIYVVLSLGYFWFDADKYVENLQLIRKSFYVLFVVGIGIAILIEEIDMKEWAVLLEWVALFVFIDLAVFQTPDILKIWNAEFQHNNYFRSIIKANQNTIDYNSKKVQNFTEVISKTEEYFDTKTVPTQWNEYENELSLYLHLYADTFSFHTSIKKFDTTTNSHALRISLTQALNQVELGYNLSIEDSEWKTELIQQLLDGKSIELKNKKEDKSTLIPGELKDKVYVVAYYGKSYNMLITISSNFIEVDGIDASHVLNLAQIYDWYMV